MAQVRIRQMQLCTNLVCLLHKQCNADCRHDAGKNFAIVLPAYAQK